MAAFLAFTPSLLFVVFGAPRFDRLRASVTAQSFLDGAGPTAIGAYRRLRRTARIDAASSVAGDRVVLAAWLLLLRQGVTTALLGAGVLGVTAALTGLALS